MRGAANFPLRPFGLTHMIKPLIGITTDRYISKYNVPGVGVAEAYVHSIAQAGGIPVLIPLGLPDEQLQEMLYSLDGLLLTGGGDIDAAQYGAQPTPKVKGVDPDRDRVERILAEEAVTADLPFFGICRGIQTLNVVLGGSLYTDIGDQFPNAIEHTFFPDWPRNYLAHEVAIHPESLLAEIVGATTLQVNSLHHQGIDRLAPELQAIAHAPDGLIEAAMLPDHPFGLAVQWHPEWLQEHPPMRALFEAFVGAAREGE